MKHNRRNFLKRSSLIAGSLMVSGLPVNVSPYTTNIFTDNISGSGKMKLKFKPYTLQLEHVFTIAVSSRSTTPVVLTEIEYDGITGYGEAAMPPYLGESQETAAAFLSKVDLSRFNDPFEMEDILNYVDSVAERNTAAKASVDIALHDLVGKLLNKPWYRIWGFDKDKAPYTDFTIGIDTPDVVKQKVNEAKSYNILKIKLGRDDDKDMVEAIRSITNKKLRVDANQGWKDKNYALEMINWLNEKNVELIEQPMPKEQVDDIAWLTGQSPLPIIGDESIQRIPDVIKAHGVFSGINIKLMKCTGMREAHKMLLLAKSLGMKVMLGCMTETSCGISAASQLSPMVDWADLDGNLLITNDPFKGTKVTEGGKLILSGTPGIGLINN
ncbi:MAG: dipeptide epimerase [Ignavibacteriaceae bacterium]